MENFCWLKNCSSYYPEYRHYHQNTPTTDPIKVPLLQTQKKITTNFEFPFDWDESKLADLSDLSELNNYLAFLTYLNYFTKFTNLTYLNYLIYQTYIINFTYLTYCTDQTYSKCDNNRTLNYSLCHKYVQGR